MRLLTEFLSTKVSRTKIKATDATIYEIVIEELNRVGLDADLNHIDVSEVTKFDSLFSGIDFTGDVSEWDMSKATVTRGMFYNCRNFDCDLGNWNMSSVENTVSMFKNCSNFKGEGLSKWNIGNKLNNTELMFYNCKAFNQDISSWRPLLKNSRSMFYKCEIFNSNLNDWDMSKCFVFDHMLRRCPKFNKPLDKWTFRDRASLYFMFTDSTEFCQDLSGWDLSRTPMQSKDIQEAFLDGTSMKPEYLPKCN